LIEDIDAEIDKLVVLEGFHTPLLYVPFFTLRDDEDLSSEEEEDIKDDICRHMLHRKSHSPLTGKFSTMLLEITSVQGLPWLRQSFIDRNEKNRMERLYKLHKSILQKESLAKELALSEKKSFFIIHRQSTLINHVKEVVTLEEEIVNPLDQETESKIENFDHIDKNDNKHDHEHNSLDSPKFDDELKQDAKPKETHDINIQKLTCNQFVLDFQNVLVGEKKTMLLKLFNGATFPVVFKVDKTLANSKGFNIQPDKVLVISGELDHDKATQLQITFQNTCPKLPLGPIHVWVQMHVKEVRKTLK
jgi:hypothetical protein